MSAVARAAGVATGTAYTHYESKDALVLAAYAETKAQLAAAATEMLDEHAPLAERFRADSGWPRTTTSSRTPNVPASCPGAGRRPLPTSCPRAHDTSRKTPALAQASRADVAAELLQLRLAVMLRAWDRPALRLAAAGTELSGRRLLDRGRVLAGDQQS